MCAGLDFFLFSSILKVEGATKMYKTYIVYITILLTYSITSLVTNPLLFSILVILPVVVFIAIAGLVYMWLKEIAKVIRPSVWEQIRQQKQKKVTRPSVWEKMRKLR